MINKLLDKYYLPEGFFPQRKACAEQSEANRVTGLGEK
jgi:hypothetical protein